MSTLCRAEGDLHGFNTRVASGSFNWIIEVREAFVKLRETKAVTWSLSPAIEEFLQEVATGDSQIFAHSSPILCERELHAVSDSTMMFGTSGKPLDKE